MAIIIYSLPFFILSLVLIIIFRDNLGLIGPIGSGLIGIGCGVVSLIAGIFIDLKRHI